MDLQTFQMIDVCTYNMEEEDNSAYYDQCLRMSNQGLFYSVDE